MGTSGSTPDPSVEDVRSVFSQVSEPCAPLSAAEVATELDCPERAVQRRLEALTERGDLASRRVDGQRRVWWAVDDGASTGQESNLRQFGEFVRAVEDYAIFMLEPDGTVASWNDGAERIKGYAADDIVGEHFSTFYTDEDVDAGVPERNLDVATTDGRVEDEGRRVRQDGTQFWANVVITAIRDADGALQGFTKVTRDMTGQREFEQQLRQERDLTRRILETVPISVGVLDPDGRLVRANPHLLERHGIDESDLDEFSLTALDVYDADGEPIDEDEWPWRRVVETGESVHGFQCQIDVPDGGRQWLSVNVAPLADGPEHDDQVVAAVDDITEQKVRERQLRREYRQTEKLLRTAPIAIAVQNADGDTVMANQRAQEALGLSEREFIEEADDADWAIYDTDGTRLEPDETPSARALATGEPVYNEEVVVESANGDRLQFHINAAPLFDADGRVDRVITTGEDITELKKRERQLERRKTELETELGEILGRISDAFYALDDEFRFTHLNDQAAELLQHPRDDLLGRKLWDVFSDPATVYRENFERAIETQEPVTFEVPVDDVDTWFEFNVYPSESGLSIYFRDVSERKERERTLAKYETIVETVDDGIYVKDGDGYFTMVNEAYAELTGYEKADLVGAHASLVVDEETMTQVDGPNAASQGEDGDGPVREAMLRTASGETVPTEGTFATIETDGGEYEQVGVVRDITRRKEYERQLEASNERLEQFAYAASHDLQEPLRMVSSYLRLVDQRYADELDEDGEEFIEYAVNGADRMREMIEGLLEYSRVEAQGESFEELDLETVLSDARDDLQLQIAESGASITAESLPTVQGDPAQLRQVFQNLLDNAIEYSGGEPPRIAIDAERAGDEWRVDVSDAGIGIDPGDADRIFDVFQRLHNRDDHAGTGIGLALCRRIVERHGGDIWVDAEPGEGSTFSFTLPAEDETDG